MQSSGNVLLVCWLYPFVPCVCNHQVYDLLVCWLHPSCRVNALVRLYVVGMLAVSFCVVHSSFKEV
jgi:Fe2+ transport system protein B